MNFVFSLAEDVIPLREHFIANLLEEHREIFHQKITDEIQHSIDGRIEAFMEIINEPKERRRRNNNDLLLNEKCK